MDHQTDRSRSSGGAGGRDSDARRSMFDDLRAHNERRMTRSRLRTADRRQQVEREIQIARQRRLHPGD